MEKELTDVIREVEERIRKARDSNEDISADYHEKEDTLGYELQEALRHDSRSLVAYYGEAASWNASDALPYAGKVLLLLKEVRELFGNHPFHHVIEGRLAEIVKISDKNKIPVPAEFIDDYRYFDSQSYNNPHLNYNTPRDAIACGRLNAVPPDWKSV